MDSCVLLCPYGELVSYVSIKFMLVLISVLLLVLFFEGFECLICFFFFFFALQYVIYSHITCVNKSKIWIVKTQVFWITTYLAAEQLQITKSSHLPCNRTDTYNNVTTFTQSQGCVTRKTLKPQPAFTLEHHRSFRRNPKFAFSIYM